MTDESRMINNYPSGIRRDCRGCLLETNKAFALYDVSENTCHHQLLRIKNTKKKNRRITQYLLSHDKNSPEVFNASYNLLRREC